ncbi:glyoxylate/hydroxypyruvate reductase HPR3-like [Prosopis cineraria]|uniref:glyoxylate/hydroxypyruvate reductase HPR3-like n=1 Tax=Prosopis cineraria TaxID=364024 RepID=UPI00240ECC15|nr:glyoxylate/hydroxypyruvate reductase HPR3-like [Prosopis cineraria]
MGDQDHHSQQSQDLPHVLVLYEHHIFNELQRIYSHKFHFILLPSSSSAPLDQFLTAHNYDPSSIRAAVGAYRPITADILGRLPSLGLLVTPSVGYNHIDLTECRRRGIKVANVGTVLSEDVADAAVGMFIDLMRKISAGDRYMRSMNISLATTARNFPLGSKVRGKRVGIVGLGSIGLEIAKRLEAFGCIISYNSRTQKSTVPYIFYSNVVELASSCDALIICCPLNEQTRHIINRQVMLALGKEGVIVNVGRGALIDEKELVKCLMEGEIGGAGLDVFEDEPNVPKELFDLDNVVLSPHTSAVTSESMRGVIEIVGENLEAFYSNKPLITSVLFD